MAVATHSSMSSIMGPTDNVNKEMIKANTTTDNELLPGLDIADQADPKVKSFFVRARSCYADAIGQDVE